MKEGAEQIGTKVQAKVESVVKNINEANKDNTSDTLKLIPRMETTHVMEVARLILSLIHSWGLDKQLDLVCENELGLLRPMVSRVDLVRFEIAFYLIQFILSGSDFIWNTVKGWLHVPATSNVAKLNSQQTEPRCSKF